MSEERSGTGTRGSPKDNPRDDEERRKERERRERRKRQEERREKRKEKKGEDMAEKEREVGWDLNAKEMNDEYLAGNLDARNQTRFLWQRMESAAIQDERTSTQNREEERHQRELLAIARERNELETTNMVAKMNQRASELSIDRWWNLDEASAFHTNIVGTLASNPVFQDAIRAIVVKVLEDMGVKKE